MVLISKSAFVFLVSICFLIPEFTYLHIVNGFISSMQDSKIVPSFLNGRKSRIRRHQDPTSDQKTPYCPHDHASIPSNRPLLCYQCKGEARQKDSICDNTLWHFARKTEQYNLRVRCPNNRGFYCVKVIQEKDGIRKTDRGCLGRGPVRVLTGKVVPLNEGCVVYNQNGYITTTCLCRKDLCNFAPQLRKSAVLVFAITILFCCSF